MNEAAEIGLTLEGVAVASFRSNALSDAIGQRLKDRLGLRSHNIPARFAIARSLSVSSPPAHMREGGGRVIKGEVLFGARGELACWVSLIVEHSGRALTLRAFQSAVQAHWVRGMKLLGAELDFDQPDVSSLWEGLLAPRR